MMILNVDSNHDSEFLMFVFSLMVKVVRSFKGNNGGSCILVVLIVVRLEGCR